MDNHYFKSNGIVLVFDGFKKIYNYSNKNKDEAELPLLSEKDTLIQSTEAEYKEVFTSPPARYTEATLVRDLEKKGIGRPSTYASIVDNIVGRKYVKYFQKQIHPTELGEVLSNMLVKNFPQQMDVKFTANVEKQLDLIESGELKMKAVLSEFWEELLLKIKDAYATKSLKPDTLPLEEDCSKCENGSLFLKWINNTEFAYCDRCDFKSPVEVVDLSKIKFVELKEGDQKQCNKCGGIMAKRKGKFGEFWACTNYPECSNTMPMTTGVNCPT